MPVEPPIEVPRSLAEAYGLLSAASRTPIAGGTDLMVRITGEIGSPPERMIDLSRLDELRGIHVADGELTLGALTTYTDIRRSRACASRKLAKFAQATSNTKPTTIISAAAAGTTTLSSSGLTAISVIGITCNAVPAGQLAGRYPGAYPQLTITGNQVR